MDVKERRRNVEKLYKRGTKTEKIAKLLGISVRTVERDISFLQGHNKEKTEETILSVHREIISRRKKEEEPEVPKLKRSKEVAKRRENVARLYTKGKTVREIAEELGVTVPIIYQDIRLLIKEGKVEKREKSDINGKKEGRKRSKEVAKRREEVVRLYTKGKTVREIAEELGISLPTIYQDIRILVKEGKIEKREREESKTNGKKRGRKRSKKVSKRREDAARLYKEGKTAKEISEELGVSVSIIYQDIRILIKEGKIEKREKFDINGKKEGRKRSKEVAKRREEVVRLYTKGKTVREIAEELGVSVSIIYQDIRILIEEGKIEKREEKKSQKNSENEKRKISRRAEEKNEKPEIDVDEEITTQESKYMKIDALYRENKSYGEIADELNLSILEVMEYLQQIKLNKSTEAVISDRKTMVKKLYEEGKTLEEIANDLNISEALVKEDLLAFGIIPGLELVKEKRKEEQSQDKQESEEEKIVNKKEVIGKTPKSHILGIKERREKVEKLYDEGMEEEEIASKLGVSVRVVRRDIEALLDARMIQDKSTKAKIDDNLKKEEEARILKRREQIERLYKEGKSAQEIAEELGISKEIVIEDIKILIRDGKLPKGNRKEFSKDRKERIVNRRKKIFEERRKKVAELYNEGRSLEEIAEKLGVTVWIVRNDINVLVRRKIIKRRVDKQVKKESEGNEIRKEEDEERRKKVEKLYNEGTAVAEIIQRLNVSRNKIYRRHRCTRKNGKN